MSNGSERVRELPTPKPDYEALIAEARRIAGLMPTSDAGVAFTGLADAVEALLAMEQRLTDHIVQLAAERDAAQRIIESHRCGENVELAYRRTLDAQAERDALRTQLDSMTTEWGIRADDDDEPYTDIYQSLSALADEFDGSLARENEHVVKRRAPGPWTAVEEGDDQ